LDSNIGEDTVNGRVVVKFGGADLSTGEKIRHAAELVVKSPYKEKVVVVSAMGNATDSLLGTISQIGGVSDEDYAQVVSMGERTSARVFRSALRAFGAKAVVFDPADENWPIISEKQNQTSSKPECSWRNILCHCCLTRYPWFAVSSAKIQRDT
jgi:aspartokinase